MRADSTRHCERGRRGLLGQRPPERMLVMAADVNGAELHMQVRHRGVLRQDARTWLVDDHDSRNERDGLAVSGDQAQHRHVVRLGREVHADPVQLAK